MALPVVVVPSSSVVVSGVVVAAVCICRVTVMLSHMTVMWSHMTVMSSHMTVLGWSLLDKFKMIPLPTPHPLLVSEYWTGGVIFKVLYLPQSSITKLSLKYTL